MWEIVDYVDKHFQEMLNMTTEYYGEDNDISNGDFVNHEYFLNPAGKAFIKLAYDKENDCLAGQYIVIPRYYAVNGNVYKTVLSLNTLTRDTYRGQQIFTKLAEEVYRECAKRKICFCYGAPNPNSFPGFIKKLAFRNMGEIPLYLKITNPYRLLCDKLHILSSARKDASDTPLRMPGIRVVEITNENVEYFDQFWGRITRKYPVLGVRDTGYIRWRYLDMPRRDYKIYMAFKDNLPCGYIIGRISTVANMRCGMIVDFLIMENMDDVGEALLKILTRHFKNHKIGLLGCLMQEWSDEAKYLRKKGFFICPHRLLPQPFPIIFRQFCELQLSDNKIIGDFKKWFFTMGDYDVI